MNIRLPEAPTSGPAGPDLTGEGHPENAFVVERCPDDVRGPDDKAADDRPDSEVVVMLDENGFDDLDDGDGNGDGDGDDADQGDGDDERAAGWTQSGPQPELSDERRDKVVVRIVAGLAAGILLFMGSVMIAGALGWIQPACGGVFVTRTAQCGQPTPSYQTVDQISTPDWSRYRLDTPAGGGH